MTAKLRPPADRVVTLAGQSGARLERRRGHGNAAASVTGARAQDVFLQCGNCNMPAGYIARVRLRWTRALD